MSTTCRQACTAAAAAKFEPVGLKRVHSLVPAAVLYLGAGITAGKTLSEQGVKNILFLEATDRIGGRMRRGEFAGETIELGATWVEGVNGPEVNPIWTLAQDIKLRTFFSDYSNVSTNIYGSRCARAGPPASFMTVRTEISSLRWMNVYLRRVLARLVNSCRVGGLLASRPRNE